MILPSYQVFPESGNAISPPISTVPLFPTTWPSTENPISQGGIWTQGGTVGLDWQNTQSTGGSPGIAFGSGSSPTDSTDPTSSVQGRFSTTKHFSQLTVNRAAGYTPPDSHEIELWVGMTISAHSLRGYEIDMPFSGAVQFVRSNGALNDFDVGVFTTLSGGPFSDPADGDVIKVIYDSTSGSPVFTVFLNTVQVWQVTDTSAGKIISGSPGIGFFARPGTGLDMTKYCNKGFDCGNA